MGRVPQVGDRIEMVAPWGRWVPATITKVGTIEGHLFVSAEADSGASVCTWWHERSFRFAPRGDMR